MPLLELDLENDYIIQPSENKGSNDGGFFTQKSDRKSVYIKWLPKTDANTDRIKNEFLALKLYELFEVNVPKAELVTFVDKRVEQIGISTAKQEGITPISEAFDSNFDVFSKVRQLAQNDFIIDCLLANYDVVGLEMDNLHFINNSNIPFRIDTGGALGYKATGEKKQSFGEDAGEFEDMVTGQVKNTVHNEYVLFQAGCVFNGAYQSGPLEKGLTKLNSISENEIRKCVNDHFYDSDTEEGKKNNEEMISVLLKRRQNLIQKAVDTLKKSTELNADLDEYEKEPKDDLLTKIITSLDNNLLSPVKAVEKFPDDLLVLGYALDKDSSVIRYIVPNTIIKLLSEKIVSPDEAVGAFPNNPDIVFLAYSFKPEVLRDASPGAIISLIEKNSITPAQAVTTFPNNKDIITAAYKQEPNSIRHAKDFIVLELMQERLITTIDAVRAFPNNEEIKNNAEASDKLIDLINRGIIDPEEAVKTCPDDTVIIEAAYKIQLKNIQAPTSLMYADIQAINRLGRAEKISVDILLPVFSQKFPDMQAAPSQKDLDIDHGMFLKALNAKDGVGAASYFNKFWFQQKEVVEKQDIINSFTLGENWNELAVFEKACMKTSTPIEGLIQINPTEHILNNDVQGPLQKTQETIELEALARKMMLDGDFVVNVRDRHIFFTFKDQTEFDWTRIQANSDLQHIDLTPEDMQYYKAYNLETKGIVADAFSIIEENDERDLRYALYNPEESSNILNSSKQEGLSFIEIKAEHESAKTNNTPINTLRIESDQLISLQEMQAINIFSGSFYNQMNGLMRNDLNKFDCSTADTHVVRSALINSVMAASGLRKIPNVSISKTYRGASINSINEIQKLIHSASNNDLVELNGFLSTSTHWNTGDFISKNPITYTFYNVIGAYIAPISMIPEENEFLIPQTQVRIFNYKFENEKHQFEAYTLSDASFSRKKNFLIVLQGLCASALSSESQKNSIIIQELSKILDPKEEEKKAISQMIIKIRNAYIRDTKPSEPLIRNMINILANKKEDSNISELPKQNWKMNFLLDKLRTDHTLCNAFGFEKNGTPQELTNSIDELIKKNINGDPLFPESTLPEHSVDSDSPKNHL